MYEQEYHLTAEPFSLTPDPEFLYLGPGHREALAALEYGLLARRGFITMIGEVGTGKTTLLYALLRQLRGEIQTAYIAHTRMDFCDLLRGALRDLGADASGTTKRDLLDALNAHLTKRADAGGTTALVVDEAQNLSNDTFEELRLLSNFETYTHKLLQIVLVGQPELQDRLRQPSLRQLRERVSVRAVINPLSPTEMQEYIDHRLALAGSSAQALFDPQALNAIVRATRGIPRRANILCHNALLFAYGKHLQRVDLRAAREAIAEMRERRPGLIGGAALKRLTRSLRFAWALPVAVAVPFALSSLQHVRSTTADAGSGVAAAIDAATPPVADAAPPADASADAAPVVAASAPAELIQTAQADLLATPPVVAPAAAAAPPPPAARDAVAAVRPATASAAVPPAPVAVEPARVAVAQPPADDRPSPRIAAPAPAVVPPAAVAPPPRPERAIWVNVPKDASLMDMLEDIYGRRLTRREQEGFRAAVQRLNPGFRPGGRARVGEPLRIPILAALEVSG